MAVRAGRLSQLSCPGQSVSTGGSRRLWWLFDVVVVEISLSLGVSNREGSEQSCSQVRDRCRRLDLRSQQKRTKGTPMGQHDGRIIRGVFVMKTQVARRVASQRKTQK